MDEEVTREDLRRVRNWADEMVTSPGLTRLWRRAYAQLSTAADHVDAMLARSEVEESAKEPDYGPPTSGKGMAKVA